MRQRVRAARANDSGFTLLNLLVVTVTIGVIAGVTVFAVGGFNNGHRIAACRADKKNVEVAAKGYLAATTAYPTGADDAARIGALVSARYLNEAPAVTSRITLDASGSVASATC
jgi:general secretion pathway protein G